jgi:hypothetical protein
MDSFSYLVSLKLVSGSMTLLQKQYPGAIDLTLASRDFEGYSECITSCKRLMDDLRDKANAEMSKPIFKVSSEVNPIFSGQDTLSKDWEAAELARIWVFDEAMEKKAQIQAIGQARIFKTHLTSHLGRH